jgi:hypothetical protein
MEASAMTVQLPLAQLIGTRMHELGLDRQALGFRLGYQNPLKAAGRVDALCGGHISSRKSRLALRRLPGALEISQEVVLRACRDTEDALAQRKRQEEEERRITHEKEEIEWRAAFTPHAILHTQRTAPSSITMCAFTGGPRRWLRIDFDLSQPPITFVRQALAALPEKARKSEVDGRCQVSFFGEVLGFIVNYTPDKALRCDLEGQPLEVLPKAYRLKETSVFIRGKHVPSTVVARVLGTVPRP